MKSPVVAGILAVFLLGIFIVANEYRSYLNAHQSIDPFNDIEREQLPEHLEGKGTLLVFHDFESGNQADTSLHLTAPGHAGKQSIRLNSRFPFSPGLWIRFSELNTGDSAWLRGSGYVWFSGNPDDVKCSLVATCIHRGINFKYMFIPLENENLTPSQWNKVTIDYRIPQPPSTDDVLQVYFWYRGNGEVLVDDVKVEFWLN
ncbi:MAG: hypothetical protein NT004_05900 [Bacteroidetes bacterium]|nr:hypothetical protein [Bacteroidota bacterium]